MVVAPPIQKTLIDTFLVWDLSVIFPNLKNMLEVPGGFRCQIFFHSN